MKILKIESNLGFFLHDMENFLSIDKLTKESILKLVNWALEENVEFDAYDENLIKNQAHQIVYRSVYEKLRDLISRREEFRDESDRMFLKEFEKYSEPIVDVSQ